MRNVVVVARPRGLRIPWLHAHLRNRILWTYPESRLVLVTARPDGINVSWLRHNSTVFGHGILSRRIQNFGRIRLVRTRAWHRVDQVLRAARNAILGTLCARLLFNFMGTWSRRWRHKLLMLWPLFISNSKKLVSQLLTSRWLTSLVFASLRSQGCIHRRPGFFCKCSLRHLASTWACCTADHFP